jgi:hypothetical protein
MLVESLKNYKYLKRLVIGSNRMSEISCKVVCENFINHENLIFLDMGLYKSTSDIGELPNNVGDAGAKYVAELIEKNKKIQILSVMHNNITEMDGIKLMADALQKNDNILFFSYEQYGIGVAESIRKSIRDKLEDNIKKNIGVSYPEFHKNHLRYIRGSTKLKNIDSVYRNNM